MVLPRWHSGKEPSKDSDLTPGLGRSPGEGNDNPLQYSWLENSMDSGVSWVTVDGVAELDTTEHIQRVYNMIFKVISLDEIKGRKSIEKEENQGLSTGVH